MVSQSQFFLWLKREESWQSNQSSSGDVVYVGVWFPCSPDLPGLCQAISRRRARNPAVLWHGLRDPGGQHLLREEAQQGLPPAGPAGCSQWPCECHRQDQGTKYILLDFALKPSYDLR